MDIKRSVLDKLNRWKSVSNPSRSGAKYILMFEKGWLKVVEKKRKTKEAKEFDMIKGKKGCNN